MCCEQQETREPEGQPGPPFFSLCSLLRSPSAVHCQLTLRDPFVRFVGCKSWFALWNFFCLFVLNQYLLLKYKKTKKKQQHWKKHWIWPQTGLHIIKAFLALPVLKMFPLNRSYFIPLAEMKMWYSTVTPGKLTERASNGQQHRDSIL